MQYYPAYIGPLESTNIGYVQWSRISDSWDQYNAWYATYNTQVSAYEVLRNEYNLAVAADAIRASSPIGVFIPSTGLP